MTDSTEKSQGTQLTIVKATILVRSGPDEVVLSALASAPIWPFEPTTRLKLETVKGMGEKWVREHLPGVEIQVIET